MITNESIKRKTISNKILAEDEAQLTLVTELFVLASESCLSTSIPLYVTPRVDNTTTTHYVHTH